MVSLVTLVITQSNPRFVLWPVFAPRQNINFQFEFTLIDTVNQANWCLSIKLRLECFVIVV